MNTFSAVLTSRSVRVATLALAVLLMLPAQVPISAQPAPPAAQPALPPTVADRSATEILIPPQGGAAEVRIHAGTACILAFPDKLSSEVVIPGKGTGYAMLPTWEQTALAVRVIKPDAGPTTMALSSASIKVNVTIRVVPLTEPALTMVRFKGTSEIEAFEAGVAAEVARRLGPARQRLEKEQQELEQARRELDARVRERSDRQIADQFAQRSEIVRLNSHARNRDAVILSVYRAMTLGDDGYLLFEIHNRSDSPYRLATVRVNANGRDVAGAAYLVGGVAENNSGVIGVVPPGSTRTGAVVVPLAQTLVRRSLALEISMQDGRSSVRADRGIEFR